ncbi:unnamed protein product [Merluccius merluccius]
MGPTWLLELGIVIVIAQAWASPSEQQKCVAGFKMDGIVFKVEREFLHRGRLLGNVGFDDCMGRNRFAFNSSDSHFKVELDGTLKVGVEITLHGGQRDFVIYSQNSKGHNYTTTVRVIHGNGHQHDDNGHHNHGNHPNKNLPVLHFPTPVLGLHRQKRTWVVPPFNLLENDRGPFPKPLVQIRSSADKEVKIEYEITGPGSNEPPVHLFTIDKTSGQIYVTQPLDREKQDNYLLKAHANRASGVGPAEAAMDVVIKVLDANDNRPVFTKEPFVGEVAEDSAKDYEVITIVAKDADDPTTNNAIVHYKILSQKPDALFDINPVTGAIRYLGSGLDREKNTKYTLEVEAADMEGRGMAVKGHVILTVTDSNDNAPAFVKSKASTYEAMVPENKVGALVLKMSVTDGDEPHSPAWNAKFKIVGGDFLEQFAVETGPSKQEGIITTVKGLDYETSSTYTLLVTVENEVPFAGLRPTATATVVVSVEDVNEAPVFSPSIKVVGKKEDLSAGTDIVQYTATDPDTARSQKISYKIIKDPAQWLSVNKDTGMIKVKSAMDREGHYVEDNKYTVLIAAYDNDDVPATGTGTLEIKLEDVNDNIPSINERSITVCNRESAPHLLSVTDADGPDFSAPYTVSLQGMSKNNWTARMNDTKTGIILTLVMPLTIGDYSVVLRVADNHGLEQDNTVQATVCDCSGADVKCKTGRVAGIGLPYILGILGAILLLLLLGLLLLMFLRRRGGEKKEPLLQEDDIRDNIYYYDEEGGGEDDQDYYDLSVLHRGLDNRPDVFRNDVVPNFLPAAQYRPRPANPEDIGNFIDDNLKAADNDPLAPPYDSLLVFDDEGKGSDAGTLSSLNSSSSGDQEYDCLNQWGPRFKKLADMYGGGEDDML